MSMFPKSAFGQTVFLVAALLLINQVVSYITVSLYVVKPTIEQVNLILAKQIKTVFIDWEDGVEISDVHRVQRVPDTETQGRVHTSAATVAVLPEAEEVDLKIKESDLRIDVFRAGGPGGQSVNTTDSAVRITHIPSGLSVSQQDEKSQHKNKAKGMKILRARLYELERSRIDQERSQDRKSKIGSGDRSERIRTYNFPQGRVTDHRINLTLHKLDEFLEGEIFDEMIESLTLQAQEESLNNL